MTARIRAWFAGRVGRLVLHDGSVAIGVGIAYLETTRQPIDRGVILAAAVIAAKAFLRLILPVPAAKGTAPLAADFAHLTRGNSAALSRLSITPAVPQTGLYLREFVQSPVLRVRLPEHHVPGKRLGRHVHHDERSRAYAYQAAPVTGIPLRSVRHTRHVGVYDQGDVGSCTGNAGAGALSTAPFTHRYTESRALKIYSAAEVIDGDGPYPPNDNGSSGLSVAKALKAAGLIGSYAHCFTPEAVYTALQDGPVMLGVSWLSGFDTPTADGQMVYRGSVRGGHEIVADELDVERQRVWITNSWSASWGLAGRAWWSWADLAKVLADNGDATVLQR